MQTKFTPLIISLLPCSNFSALLWSDGRRCDTMDFVSLADAQCAFDALCRLYPSAVRVINGEIQLHQTATISEVPV